MIQGFLSRRFATEEHGRKTKQKQKNLPRINTEKHGKDRSIPTEIRPRISRRICQGLTRNFTEGGRRRGRSRATEKKKK